MNALLGSIFIALVMFIALATVLMFIVSCWPKFEGESDWLADYGEWQSTPLWLTLFGLPPRRRRVDEMADPANPISYWQYANDEGNGSADFCVRVAVIGLVLLAIGMGIR